MSFDSQPGSSGFAWLEVTSDGVTRVRRITVAEQPRADIEIETERLFPASRGADDAGHTSVDTDATLPAIPPLPALPVLTPDGQPAEIPSSLGDDANSSGATASRAPRIDTQHPESDPVQAQGQGAALFATLRQALDEAGSDETLVRLRLVGPITRDQYHLLPLRELRFYGNQRNFAFELDTAGLELIDPIALPRAGARSASGVQRAAVTTGPLSPAFEVERLLQDRLGRVPADDSIAVEDLHAAASILLARLRASGASSDREADS
jgi:hypothetical protein